jgi:hypothetical protein
MPSCAAVGTEVLGPDLGVAVAGQSADAQADSDHAVVAEDVFAMLRGVDE